MTSSSDNFCFTQKELNSIKSRGDLDVFLQENYGLYDQLNQKLNYERELQSLQVELLKLQNWILKKQKRVVIIFEGRDAAGKGGTIRRFTRYLKPRSMRLVALGNPPDTEHRVNGTFDAT